MVDIDKLIAEVEKRPPLFAVQFKDHSNKKIKAKCWAEVGKAMYEDWDEMSPESRSLAEKTLMKKWKTVRDNFVRDLRIIMKKEAGEVCTQSKKRRYMFFDQLSFLTPHVKCSEQTPQPEKNTPIKQEQESDQEDAHCVRDNIGDSVPNLWTVKRTRRQRMARKSNTGKTLAIASKNLSSVIKESIAVRNESPSGDKINDTSGNKAFLLSFLPVMDSLPMVEALDVRMKITEIFRNAKRDSITH